MKPLKSKFLKVLTGAGVFCLVVPVSIYGIWIYSSNAGKTHADSVAIFDSFFPGFLQGRFDMVYVSLGFCVIAIIFSIRGLKLPSKSWQNMNLVVLILSSLFLLLNLFQLM